jgi:conserved oligomeric Golgi complex subunit 3
MKPPPVVSTPNTAFTETEFEFEESTNGKEDSIMVQETLRETENVVQSLTTQLKYTTSLKLGVRACINIADDISNRHAELIRHSGELSAAADRLQEEEQMLSRHAEEIGLPLQHYDAVDRIGVSVGVLFKGQTTVRGLAKIKVDSDEFPMVLDEIDKAIVYFGNGCGGKEALQAELKRRTKKEATAELTSGNVEYYRRSLALQEAALDLVKEAVAERISTTTQQVSAVLNIAKGSAVLADQLEASIIYTRFHGISSRSNRLLSLVKTRIPNSATSIAADDSGVGDAYQELFQHCCQIYCSCRESLLRTTVRTHIEKLKNQHGPVGMTRLASVFLIRLCTVETAMYRDFFGDLKTENKVPGDDAVKTTKSQVHGSMQLTDDAAFKSTEFQSYLTSLCSPLHRTVRHALVTMVDLDSLCQIVSVLREERSLANASPTTMSAARAMTSVIQDAQERLIFCANSTLTKEVVKFQATPADLNYPDKLRKRDLSKEQETAISTDDDAVEQHLQQVYESWFPPIRTVLKILSKIFRVVETRVFEDMALQAVRSCTKCLKNGAEYIKKQKSEIDADLFLVKHFLILREQLSPFDIELRSVERQLDFSDAGKAVARFLANRNRRVFSVSTENALITLLREGVSVQEASVDSKRDLEDALRSSCNDFIEHTAYSMAYDLLGAVESYKSRDASNHLRDAESVVAMLKKTYDSLEGSLLEVKTQMSLYLDNPATQAILLKPVSRKITRGIEEIRKLAQSVDSGVNGWEDEQKGQVVELALLIEEVLKSATKTMK